jgi:hypothetical protein
LPEVRGLASAQVGRTLGSFHGQDQNQQGLIQTAIIELRCLSQDVGDELVSQLEFVQDGGLQFHKQGGGVAYRAGLRGVLG